MLYLNFTKTKLHFKPSLLFKRRTDYRWEGKEKTNYKEGKEKVRSGTSNKRVPSEETDRIDQVERNDFEKYQYHSTYKGGDFYVLINVLKNFYHGVRCALTFKGLRLWLRKKRVILKRSLIVCNPYVIHGLLCLTTLPTCLPTYLPIN